MKTLPTITKTLSLCCGAEVESLYGNSTGIQAIRCKKCNKISSVSGSTVTITEKEFLSASLTDFVHNLD